MSKILSIASIATFSVAIHLAGAAAADASPVNTSAAYSEVAARAEAVNANFYVYKDADSGFNHGFPSGYFADPLSLVYVIQVNSACIDDRTAPSGCSTDPNALDRARVNVLQVVLPPMASNQFSGVNIEEPQNWGAQPRGIGYDLRGSSQVVFDARSPDEAQVQFGVGGCVTPIFTLSKNWQTFPISLNSLQPPLGSQTACPPDLSNVHILFTVATSGAQAPAGATVLLDNIRFEPVPAKQLQSIGLPLATATFGVVPLQVPAAGRVSIPPDQANRNIATAYESALAIFAFLARGTPEDRVDAQLIANAFHAALHHDTLGDPLPLAVDGSAGIHDGYSAGDLLLLNSQGSSGGDTGQVRLAGFSADSCSNAHFCIELDGATGGNDAFSVMALLAAYRKLGESAYLEDAHTIADWIATNLADTSGTGYGGYYVGYPDNGKPYSKPLNMGKSTENNADIFSAFSQLAAVEQELGKAVQAALWTARANSAGDYVIAMFDNGTGCFFGGSVPSGTLASAGVSPNGKKRGDEVINTFLFLDSNSFTALELAQSSRYRNQIDWRQPMRCVLGRFGRSVQAASLTYDGFSIDTTTAAGPTGIAWEFTSQAVVMMKYIDALYRESTFAPVAAAYLRQIAQAQAQAPFGDGSGLVASTMQGGNTLAPLDQCLTTPFQCIPERVGLAATTWALFAALGINPLAPPSAAGPQAFQTTTPPAMTGE